MKDNFTIILAPDSFKESMTAKEVCESMERGIKKADIKINCVHVPMADGGEGTMDSLVSAAGGKKYFMKVIGPLGNEVEATYGILGDGETGIIEMASASGLHLVPPEKRDPLSTTTYGTGQLIEACLDKKVKKLILGIGGSATNDGGMGLIQALGGKFMDKDGNELGFGGGELGKLVAIDLTNLDCRLKKVAIEVACDVTNPLCGINGASYVFGAQKGATYEMMQILDRNLMNYAKVIKNELGIDVLNIAGAGAAGGLGAGILTFLNGKLKKGVDIVVKYTKLEEKVKCADMVWTGEGSLDSQTQYGKTPFGVAAIARKYKKPVIVLAGKIGDDVEYLYENGISSVFCIIKEVTTLQEALVKGKENIEKTSENIIRLMNVL